MTKSREVSEEMDNPRLRSAEGTARFVAEGLGLELRLLSDNLTWRIELPQGTSLQFALGHITCSTPAKINLPLSVPPDLYQTPRGDKFVLFDEYDTQTDKRQRLIVTTRGDVDYSTNPNGAPLPHHLLGSSFLR